MVRSGQAGPGDREGIPLSPLIHGRVRLLLLATLVRTPKAHSFTELRNGLHLTDGSLSVNLSKLEAAGLVAIEKTFVGKRPQTLVRVTEQGQHEFQQYLAELRNLLPELEQD